MKTFLEIGVADFDTLLPLAEKGGWSGWCVEPMPHHVKTLREQAKGLPVAICECAISDRTGSIRMAVGGGEKWAEGASHVIDDNHLGRRLLDWDVNQHFRYGEATVQCLTLDDFIDYYHIDRLDFCKIDVEGHEMNILGNYSWRVKPKLIKCEHKHIDDGLLDQILTSVGYTTFLEKDDLYAIL
jgi:FkbM family methyltransferase